MPTYFPEKARKAYYQIIFFWNSRSTISFLLMIDPGTSKQQIGGILFRSNIAKIINCGSPYQLT